MQELVEVEGEPPELTDEPVSPDRHDTRRVDSEPRESRSLLAVVRELHSSTNRLKDIEDASEMGCQLLELEPGTRYWQVTFVDNGVRPNESFTALVPDRLAKELNLHVMVMVEMSACMIGDWAGWRVTRAKPL